MRTVNQIEDDRHTPVPILGAALIASLGIYVPIPILRGAIFGLFAGVALRSARISFKGALCGAALEILYYFFWVALLAGGLLRMDWEPRDSFNTFLVLWLPGRLGAVTHMGSPWPNAVQFYAGLLVWFNVMVCSWWIPLKPRPPASCLARILVITTISVAIACSILWIVSPMDHWWYRGRAPFADLHGAPWMIVYLCTFPLCGLIIAGEFRKASSKLCSRRTDAMQNHYIQRPDGC